MAAVRGYARMIPRLQAEEALAAMDVAAMGNSASFAIKDVQRAQRDLQRIARGGEVPRAARPTPAALAAMGIEVVAAPVPAELAH